MPFGGSLGDVAGLGEPDRFGAAVAGILAADKELDPNTGDFVTKMTAGQPFLHPAATHQLGVRPFEIGGRTDQQIDVLV